MIEYKTINKLNRKTIIELYKSAKWTNYTKNPEKLFKGIQNSLYTLGAFKKNQLIGLIRIVGDGYTIVYIQDIIVHPNHQSKGIGQELMKKILIRYEFVRQKILLADHHEGLDRFYKKMGFIPSPESGLTCYVRLD